MKHCLAQVQFNMCNQYWMQTLKKRLFPGGFHWQSNTDFPWLSTFLVGIPSCSDLPDRHTHDCLSLFIFLHQTWSGFSTTRSYRSSLLDAKQVFSDQLQNQYTLDWHLIGYGISNSNFGGGSISPNDLFDLFLPIVMSLFVDSFFPHNFISLNEIAIVSCSIRGGRVQWIQNFSHSNTLILILQFCGTEFYTTVMHVLIQSQGRLAWHLAITSQNCQESTSWLPFKLDCDTGFCTQHKKFKSILQSNLSQVEVRCFILNK